MQVSQEVAVVGAGPNGLAAAVTFARAGVPVTVFEAAPTIGGGTRTQELVAPGVLHDVCSAIHPMALATGFFREFEIHKRMRFVVPEASFANPLDSEMGRRTESGSRAAISFRDLDRTVDELGVDGRAYARLIRPLVERIDGVLDFALGGGMLRWPADLPAALLTGFRTLEQGTPLWNMRFREEQAPALLAGVAAHSIGKLPNLATAGVGLVLGALAHTVGWPVPVGGSRSITDAMAADLVAHGGRIETSHSIDDIRELADYSVKVFDTSARTLEQVAGPKLPAGYRRALRRFAYGNGATKVDFILDGPIPWTDTRVGLAPTVHVGGKRNEIAAAERDVARGQHPKRPFVLLAQTEHFDPDRNDAGINAVWSYTHVPKGSKKDVSSAVISQIERFAPGFRDRITGMRVTPADELSRYNRNYHGGDFSAGAVTLAQLVARPTLSSEPWRTPTPGIYLASSSTPPGPGVHGLSGWYAAQSALRHEFNLPAPNLGLDT